MSAPFTTTRPLPCPHPHLSSSRSLGRPFTKFFSSLRSLVPSSVYSRRASLAYACSLGGGGATEYGRAGEGEGAGGVQQAGAGSLAPGLPRAHSRSTGQQVDSTGEVVHVFT